MSNKETPILSCTKQAWKYYVSMLLDSFGVFIGIFAFTNYSDSQRHLIFLLAALLVFFIGILIKHTIKCPKCNSHWYWQALKKPMSEKSIVKIRLQTKCASCGLTCENCT